MKDIYDILREWRKRPGELFALATLIDVEGSSYRRAGARMLVCQDGLTIGSLSGGCIEEEVAQRAIDVLHGGEPAMTTFDTRQRFGCHGKISILIERVAEGFFRKVAERLDARSSCFVMTTESGSRIVEHGHEQEWRLVQEIHPPIRLLLFGDGPDTMPLRSLGGLLGWQSMEIFDPDAFSIERDQWTAAVVKSHNYGRDFVALRKLLPLNLRYVGVVGARRRRDQLLNDLLDAGITIGPGLFAPAGLDLRADTPEEIALAIVTEIQSVFASGSRVSLRDRKSPIHAPERPIVRSDIIWGQCGTPAR